MVSFVQAKGGGGYNHLRLATPGATDIRSAGGKAKTLGHSKE